MTETQVYDFSMRPWKSKCREIISQDQMLPEADAFLQNPRGPSPPLKCLLSYQLFAEILPPAQDSGRVTRAQA